MHTAKPTGGHVYAFGRGEDIDERQQVTSAPAVRPGRALPEVGDEGAHGSAEAPCMTVYDNGVGEWEVCRPTVTRRRALAPRRNRADYQPRATGGVYKYEKNRRPSTLTGPPSVISLILYRGWLRHRWTSPLLPLRAAHTHPRA